MVGPNGAGKSTLLKLLYGALTPGSGSILFDGKPLSSYTKQDLSRQIAVVPADTHIQFPFMVEEVVMMGRAPYADSRWFDTRKDIEHVRRVMQLTGIDGFAGRP
ncbi:ATP-binding cassette domain-containing protein, partial [Acidobacteriota bacterium]